MRGNTTFMLLIYLLTPRCRALHEQLTSLQLVKKFPAFHGNRRFITALTSVRHMSLSRASSNQSIYPHPTSWRSMLILSTHLLLGLPSGLFPSGFLTKTLYTSLTSPIRATCPSHLILLDFITRTIYYIHTRLSNRYDGRSQWPRGLRRSAAARLLELWVWIPRGAWMFVCCVLSERKVSATSWSLVQRSPTDCGASLCVI